MENERKMNGNGRKMNGNEGKNEVGVSNDSFLGSKGDAKLSSDDFFCKDDGTDEAILSTDVFFLNLLLGTISSILIGSSSSKSCMKPSWIQTLMHETLMGPNPHA